MLPLLYGLDIETDTTTGGLDPRTSSIVAVALTRPDGTTVFTGDEHQIITDLDRHLAGAPAGVLVTWNGSKFDLPFIADRAATLGLTIGLRLHLDPTIPVGRGSLPGHTGAYRAHWHGHRHLDAFRAFADIGGALAHSCSLKTMARLCGLRPVEVDRTAIHHLGADDLRAYVASDATVTRELALLRGPEVLRYLDPAGPAADVA